MQKFYLVPIETSGNSRGPKYFDWRFDPDPPSLVAEGTRWSLMPYGFVPYGLLLAHDITQPDHDALVLNSDVYAFPDNLDEAVSDPSIDAFFEGINIPTGWLTPSTTYRELLRQTAGMFQFNQRYKGISGGQSIFDGYTLDDRLRDMTAQEEEWFYQAVESFGGSRDGVNRNKKLRSLVKAAGDFWQGQTFVMGGVEF